MLGLHAHFCSSRDQVSLAVEGAVSGISKPEACAFTSNMTALAAANGTGTVNLLCTYGSPTIALGSPIVKFRSLTAAAGARSRHG